MTKKIHLQNELTKALMTTQKFKKEHFALKFISNFIDVSENYESESVKFQIWKFYRSFQLKQFLFLSHEIIAKESQFISANNDKILQMIDRSFLWNLANKSNDNNKKYFQRYYSISVLDHLIPKYHYKFTNSTKILKGINIDITLPISSQLNNLTDYQSLNTLKNLIHNISEKKGTDIRLEHIVSRGNIKKHLENVCVDMADIRGTQLKLQYINEEIDRLIPLCFGSVVSDDENVLLSGKDAPVKEIMIEQSKIFSHYKASRIKLVDTNKIKFGSHNIEYILSDDGYDDITMQNPFDNLKLNNIEVQWNNSTLTWELLNT
jgi:hypothetical protein